MTRNALVSWPRLKLIEKRQLKPGWGPELEYDLALDATRRELMVEVLTEIHPTIGGDLKLVVDNASTDQEKAKLLFTGMFERPEGKTKVKKGQFAQALAQGISESNAAIELPAYLKAALDSVTGVVAKDAVCA